MKFTIDIPILLISYFAYKQFFRPEDSPLLELARQHIPNFEEIKSKVNREIANEALLFLGVYLAAQAVIRK